MKKVERICPAKVNLFLKILGTRPDGYHELLTLMQTIDLADSIEVWEEGSSVEMQCDQKALPTSDLNLMVKAAWFFLTKARLKTGVRMRLVKRVPVAAGLGGGSSDGAHTLLALNELFGHPLSAGDLWELAARLGSDVPFFLTGGLAVCRGRGEIVEPVAYNEKWCFVLINPGVPLSTRSVYEAVNPIIDSRLTASEDLLRIVLGAVQEKDCQKLSQVLCNDLEAPAIQKMPRLAEIKRALREAGSAGAWVAGSGPTIFGIAAKEDQAREISQKAQNLLSNKSYRFYVAKSFLPSGK